MTDDQRVEPSKRSVAAALVKQENTTEVVAWYCVTCGRVYKTQDDAERCPRKGCTEWSCEACGKPALSAFQGFCCSCLSKRQDDRHRARLAKAEAIPASEYPSDQGIFCDGSYYDSIEEFVETCEDDDIPVPDRVWATSPTPFMLNADEILENAFEDWAESCEDSEMDSICGEDEFKAAVEAFNKANAHMILYWECDKAVDLTGLDRQDGNEE